ncbi:N-acetylmuramoyl-L-alanine amidase [Kribbella deserti]|uniref:N-acetylmuramoyl-L-alanine amidase n=1 Tax=Kribbella deserti TaxID=1926257 RepID=A0ABV6QUU3_9ACTN
MSRFSRSSRLVAILTAGLVLLVPYGPPGATIDAWGVREPVKSSYVELDIRNAPGTAYATAGDPATEPFRLVGVTWPYQPDAARVVAKVSVFSEGQWSPWHRLHVEEEHGPDAGTDAHSRSGTEPLWVGLSTGVQVSLTTTDGQPVRDGKVVLIDPGASPEDEPARMATAGGEVYDASSGPAPFPMPKIVTRQGWGADESLRSHNGVACATPRYTSTIRAAFVHHTADSNQYTKAQSAAMIRSMYAYHVKGRGWCDLGYNFLVDKYGQAFEGRAGGMHLPVLGAHTGRFNADSFGVSLIGNFERAHPSSAMLDMTAQVIAWKMDAYYRSPYGKALINGATFDSISGHRDTKATACPGKNVYAKLDDLRKRVSALMGHGAATPIYRYAKAAGGLGEPFWGEHPTRAGRSTWFRYGDVYWSRATGTHSVRGAFRERYRQFGYAYGPLGLPASEEKDGRRRGTRVQDFQHKGTRAALYWSRSTGVQAMYGVIMLHYLRVGGERSRLGLPTTSPYHVRGGLAQRFQGGRIEWNSRNNRAKVIFR